MINSPFGTLFIKTNQEQYEKTAWENFWIIFNILQFSFDSINLKDYTTESGFEEEAATESYDEILENFDEKYHSLVKSLIESNIEFNKDNYFSLKDNQGIIIAEAYLGLPSHRIVIDPLDEISRNNFEANSYRVYSLENFDIEEL